MNSGQVVISRFNRVLGGVLIAIMVSSCGNVFATPQTTTTSTVAPPVEPPKWGVPNDLKPLFFYASDVPQQARDRIEETTLKATQYWPNYGPLEVWVIGIKTAPIVEMINEYCTRRVELQQMNKFACLDENRNGTFEEFRKWSAISENSGENLIQGVASDTEKYGFHQIVISYPFGFTSEHPELAAKYQQLIFHEYFHVIQAAAIPSNADTTNIPVVRKRLMGPRWFSEGTAEFMSLLAVDELRRKGELPVYEGSLDDYSFTNEMLENLDGAKESLSKNKNVTLADAEQRVEEISPYDVGPWAIAYLVSKSNPNVLLDVVYPNIAQLGWAKTFQLAFGMGPAQFEEEFMRFMKLSTTKQQTLLKN
jgi:hypothetical protein